MATLNEHTSVLTAILSDISDDSDTNLIYVLSSEQMSTTNKRVRQKEHFKTNKTPNEITICLQTNTRVT